MFKKILCTLFFYVFVITSCYAFIEADLNNLEQSNYGNVFSDEDYGSRLRRLELDLLGMNQSGDIGARLENLKKVADNLYVSESYDKLDFSPATNNSGKFRGFLNNLTSSILDSGYVTGYTPVMPSYSQDYFNDDFFYSNNNSRYCPYDNTNYFDSFNNRSQSFFNRFPKQIDRRYSNRLSKNFKKNDRYYSSKNKFNHRKRVNYHRHGMYNHPYYTSPIPTNRAQNIATRSSVTILRD